MLCLPLVPWSRDTHCLEEICSGIYLRSPRLNQAECSPLTVGVKYVDGHWKAPRGKYRMPCFSLTSLWTLGRAIGPWCTLWEMLPYYSSVSLLFFPPPLSGATPAFSPCGLGRQWTKCPSSPALGRGWVHDQEVPFGLSSFPWQGTELKGIGVEAALLVPARHE